MNDEFKFFAPIKVRFIETDAQGHVNFAHYLAYFDFGLTEYLHAIGYSYQEMLADQVDMLYVRSDCEYKARAFFEDVLNIYTRIERIGNTSVTYAFQAVKAATGEVAATGHIVTVIVDRETKQPIPVPDRLREAVASAERRIE
jgi:acyl-CoA thioester hydrolase